MARILLVGNVTLDIINTVERYPHEDEEVRALHQERRRGGNAANSAVVLSQLGHTVQLAATLAQEPDAQFIRDDLARHRVDLSALQTAAGGKVPTSYVSLSRANGSRTIVHVRDLREYTAEEFARIALPPFDWVHFEGRNLEQVATMMAQVRRERPLATVSLEVEKPRTGIDALFAQADLLLFSRGFAQQRGFDSAAALFAAIHRVAPQATLACGWGAHGAYAMGPDGRVLFTPAFIPSQVIDTLGAGDVFNAALIDGRVRGLGLEDALIAAARLAGRKCGQAGLDGLHSP